jgi:hypothetical protein
VLVDCLVTSHNYGVHGFLQGTLEVQVFVVEHLLGHLRSTARDRCTSAHIGQLPLVVVVEELMDASVLEAVRVLFHDLFDTSGHMLFEIS